MRRVIAFFLLAGLAACASPPRPASTAACESNLDEILRIERVGETIPFCGVVHAALDESIRLYDSEAARKRAGDRALMIEVGAPREMLARFEDGKAFYIVGDVKLDKQCWDGTRTCIPVRHPADIRLKEVRAVEPTRTP